MKRPKLTPEEKMARGYERSLRRLREIREEMAHEAAVTRATADGFDMMFRRYRGGASDRMRALADKLEKESQKP